MTKKLPKPGMKLVKYTRTSIMDFDPDTLLLRLYIPRIVGQMEFDFNLLSDEDQNLIIDNWLEYEAGRCKLYLEFRENTIVKGYDPDYHKVIVEELDIDVPVFKILEDIIPIPVNYIRYEVSNQVFYSQRDGIMTLCGTSGTGKTYNAIKAIPELLQQFDTILYLNWEITESDIKVRVTNQIGHHYNKNIVVSDTQNTDAIIEFLGNKNIAVIVDNIDNLVGEGVNPFEEQLNFIKKIDKHIKDNNQHCLMLTQHVKDSNIQLFDKQGKFTSQVNINILSGVKQLSNMARSVLFVSYFDGDNAGYKTKIIKKGSGKYESEYQQTQVLQQQFKP